MTGFKIVRNSYPTDSRFGQSGSNPGGSVGLWLNGCSSCEVDHNEIRGQTESGLFVSGSDDAQILANSIHDNGTTHDDHGIYFCSGQNGVLANNVVAHNYDYGIQLYCGTSYPVSPMIVSNTVVYNGTPGSGGSGMVLEAANAQVWNNIVAYNVEFGIRGWSPGSGTISRNDVFGNQSGSYYGLSSGYVVNGTILGDPQFDNVSLADYRLQSTSPAVNTASVAYSPILDMNGVVRPMGSAPDLGAYESH
jgi:parallel beta-helix repeat protein